ncbi:hypothetical protein [Cellulomonas edaphi]|uniref:PH domain-containing protein n=1 Tax=Cellulomonas edaphi TaxID=3053468 RepID=A0ABT7S3B0_9CELL|nr:hypothetical protein [Cellulomons edaphi]MDM7830113.1 hypothetical protein [Cellulomons edaphi]
MRDVLAQTPKPTAGQYALLILCAVQAVYWTVRAIAGDDAGFALMLGIGSASVAGLGGVLIVRAMRMVTLVLTDDALLLEQRSSTTTVRRSDIRAVNGDMPHRPTWSQFVIIELADEAASKLPRLNKAPGVLIPRIQRWAGVGEEPPAPL